MIIAIDFHIHSALSPCASNDMTPNNIIGMARLKGLDAIAITDHNSTKNLESILKVAQKNNMICIPGIEVTTKEEVHIITLFPNLQNANKFQAILEKAIVQKENDFKIFGEQIIYDEGDSAIGEEKQMLINATNLTVEQTIQHTKDLGGISIPAHIDRHSYSILSNLGFISPALGINVVEITKDCNYSTLKKKHPYLKNYKAIKSSDAHYLGDILEREFFIEVKELSIESIFTSLN